MRIRVVEPEHDAVFDEGTVGIVQRADDGTWHLFTPDDETHLLGSNMSASEAQDAAIDHLGRELSSELADPDHDS